MKSYNTNTIQIDCRIWTFSSSNDSSGGCKLYIGNGATYGFNIYMLFYEGLGRENGGGEWGWAGWRAAGGRTRRGRVMHSIFSYS